MCADGWPEATTGGRSAGEVIDFHLSRGPENELAGVVENAPAGDANHAFAMDAETGEITVNDPSRLDYETASVYMLEIRVVSGEESTESFITIRSYFVKLGPRANILATGFRLLADETGRGMGVTS